MKFEKLEKHFYWGITAVAVILISIFFAFIFYRFSVIHELAGKITKILMPIIYGFILSFLMAPVYDKVNTWTFVHLAKIFPGARFRRKVSKGFASLMSLAILLFIVTALFWMIIPQILSNIRDVIERMPQSLDNLEPKIRAIMADNPTLNNTILEAYRVLSENVESFFSKNIAPNINNYIISFSNSIVLIVRMIFDIVIGLMVMLYLLNMKTTLAAQAKKMTYGALSVEHANILIEEVRFVKTVFLNFIVGKIIDSAIIGVINYVVMSVFKMPYALLISVVVGVTNVVPFFGPFIGAIPCAIILLFVSPMYCLQFLVWILILQQIDGNIIGPKILGQTTGLPSFWVLFSILLFGGLFGIVGMIIGVPTFAVLYRFISRITNQLLSKKELSTESRDYLNLEYIDPDSLDYVKMKRKNGTHTK